MSDYKGGKENGGVDWSEFDSPLIDKYLPDRGEGTTKASQIVTAVNKLIYMWYNNTDVYDNTNYLRISCNDISSYANWLYTYTDDYVCEILDQIYSCKTQAAYEQILSDLYSHLIDEELLEFYEGSLREGSIYNSNGPFRNEEPGIYDAEDDDWHYDGSFDRKAKPSKRFTLKGIFPLIKRKRSHRETL